ncbi:MAG: 5-oxoprolinase (ATP-hydrolysing) [Methyloprofundus sp.]|nr:MAG: 5-oxoprolinase (ATP-hydrolysing) [Methyloprofundus sp.]
MTHNNWQFWIDRGGTFTDIVARAPDGYLQTLKLLSENPEQYLDAALEGIGRILGLPATANKAEHISAVKMGTTVGTNALLERAGEPVALLVTKGFKDVLRIAYQNRPDIFALNIQLPELLYQTVVEVDERVSAQGAVLQAINPQTVMADLQQVYDRGIRAVAIVLLHAWTYQEHELQLQAIAAEMGFTQISVSHQVSPLMKMVSRGDTTVVDAYLSPLLKRYVDQVALGLQNSKSSNCRLLFMQSSGGLIAAQRFQGKDSILSGPAGGIVGAVNTAKQAGFEKIISFDMGGTSTDVAHYAGELERSFETEVAGIRMRAPMMAIHTVAAGGGSLLFFDGIRYRVGPESAGANPGPACYRRGGALTVTDANLMLGKLPLFPQVFGPQGDQALDSERVELLFNELGQKIAQTTQLTQTAEQVAAGFIKIAVENMANAIKRISVQKGYNVADYTLCSYGAAAGQHACQVADRLAMQRILIHPFAGVLSAYGMGLADFRQLKTCALEKNIDAMSSTELQHLFTDLAQAGHTEMLAQGLQQNQIYHESQLQLRYLGTDTALSVIFADKADMRTAFEDKYRQQFGFIYADKPIIIESLAVEIIGVEQVLSDSVLSKPANTRLMPVTTTQIFCAGKWHVTPVYQREQLPANSLIQAPAIIVESTGTTVLELGWQAELNTEQQLILTRYQPLVQQNVLGTRVDPVMLEIFNKLFMSIAEQMGFVLQNTAYSVNIKERLDFSCAIFNQVGELVANAPHIPVHLGSMGDSVQALLASPDISLQPEEVYLLNSPYRGGTHLPDITVITPVFSGQKPLFLVASRGHHADIGGLTPGSMPSHSTRIQQEGLLSEGLTIVKQGQFQQQVVLNWLKSSDFPARNPEQNIADLQAQIAANAKGVRELQQMIQQYSLATVQAYMLHVQDHAEEAVRQVLTKLNDGQFSYIMDNGAQIMVNIKVDKKQRQASIDFSGTSPQQNNNFNAPAAVCKAAVLYVFRTLVATDIPLNAGCLRPLNIIIPEHCLLNPQYPAAVVAGNVETSQYIVDALYGALGVLAASQGTMNNLSFGNAQYQYYETICGGAGAGVDFAGCDAVQTHMTNSRMTDPEVLEWRFPVRLQEFSIRTASGGQGKFAGGCGTIRRLQFLEPMSINILSSHRLLPGFGLAGGEAGKLGINKLYRANGTYVQLDGQSQVNVEGGDTLSIATPGGGGYGKADEAI